MGQKLIAFGKATQAIMAALMAPQVGRDEVADCIGFRENAGAPSSVTPNFIGEWLFDTTNSVFYRAYGVSSGNWLLVGDAGLSAAELDLLDGAIAGTPVASKVLALGTTKDVGSFRMTGKLFTPQAAPETSADTVSLTDAQILSGILVATPTAAATYTMRTGTQIEAALLAAGFQVQNGDCFDLTIINLGGTGDDIDLAVAAGVTFVGEVILRPGADAGTDGMSGSGTWRFRRTAANTFVGYRVS